MPRASVSRYSASSWGSSRIIIFLTVAKAAPRQDQDHQRQCREADHEVRETVGYGGDGEQVEGGSDTDVGGPVQEDGEEHAALRVVEHPRVDDRVRDGEDNEEGDVQRAAVRRVPARDEEQGQVPQAPQDPEDDAPGERPVERLQPGESEAAPANLLEDRSPDEEVDETDHHVLDQRG